MVIVTCSGHVDTTQLSKLEEEEGLQRKQNKLAGCLIRAQEIILQQVFWKRVRRQEEVTS